MSDATTPIAIQIPPKGFEELAQMAAHASVLNDVVQVSETMSVVADDNALRNAIATKDLVSPSEAGLLISGLATLRNLMDSSGASASEILASITQSLSVQATEAWRKKNLDTWNHVVGKIEAALDRIGLDHPLLTRQKALELTYIHQNIFRRSRIITDLRPVFTKNGSDIPAMVLTHVLSVEYYDGVRRQRIEFALDEDDVADLCRAAQRAQTKTTTTREKFASAGWNLIVAGDVRIKRESETLPPTHQKE